MSPPLLIALIVVGYVGVLVLVLCMFKAARLGDRQTVDAFERSYGDGRDLEWPWPPRDRDAA